MVKRKHPRQRHARPKAALLKPAQHRPMRSLKSFIEPQNRLLSVCLVISLLLHGLMLSIRFTAGDSDRAVRDPGLKVVLVNARHAKTPDKPDVLAQANLDGGGSTDEEVTPSTPLPPQEVSKDGAELAETRRRQQEEKPQQAQTILTQPQNPAQQSPAPQPETRAETPLAAAPSGHDMLDSARAIAQLEAQIERDLHNYAKRPRRQFVGARAKEYRFAQYAEDWRLKIERIGTLNYPEAARGKIYGQLRLAVSIRADGSVEKIQITKSSGEPILDEAAIRIVRLAEPFAPFPANIRKDTDVLDIVRTWTFTNANQLNTQ